MKYHEGIDLEVLPSWDFVSFVVVAVKLSKYLCRTRLGNLRSIVYPKRLSAACCAHR